MVAEIGALVIPGVVVELLEDSIKTWQEEEEEIGFPPLEAEWKEGWRR